MRKGYCLNLTSVSLQVLFLLVEEYLSMALRKELMHKAIHESLVSLKLSPDTFLPIILTGIIQVPRAQEKASKHHIR